MPGILYHLSFAEEVFRKLNIRHCNKADFMSGNLIPDFAVDKQKSHYRIKASVEGFYIPDLTEAKKELFTFDDVIKLGMYCHLYLDYHFIETFLIPEFIWDSENMKVINPRNNKQWDVKTFFSHDGMYGSYTEINQLLLRDGHVSISSVDKIPAVLPNTGLSIFDTRIEKLWKDELDSYLKQKKEYTGEIFDYNRLWNCIERIAMQFVNEVSK